MTYAISYHSGYDKVTRRAKAKTIAPSVGRVRKLDEAHQRCKRSPKRQTTACPDSYVANGFLRTSFLPRLAGPQTVLATKKTTKMERDFYKSLSQLAEHYGIETMQTEVYEHPYNIALALWDTQEQLKNKVRNWEEIRLLQDSRKTFFSSEERYNTGSTLYYIPVIPLYRMLKTPKRKEGAQLLLSVCSYLYHIADIPYYRQENSFLYWQYEMLKEWTASDDETEQTAIYLREFDQAQWIGEKMEQKIFNGANLKMFKERLNRFKCKDTFDNECLKVAKEAFAIYKQYPNETVFRNVGLYKNAEEDEEEEKDFDDVVPMDRYISFWANGKGWLNENLLQCVNTELQEYAQVQEPVIIKHFDASDTMKNTLDFENRLFSLMEELIYLLDNF
jgi:hypothetical protein